MEIQPLNTEAYLARMISKQRLQKLTFLCVKTSFWSLLRPFKLWAATATAIYKWSKKTASVITIINDYILTKPFSKRNKYRSKLSPFITTGLCRSHNNGNNNVINNFNRLDETYRKVGLEFWTYSLIFKPVNCLIQGHISELQWSYFFINLTALPQRYLSVTKASESYQLTNCVDAVSLAFSELALTSIKTDLWLTVIRIWTSIKRLKRSG